MRGGRGELQEGRAGGRELQEGCSDLLVHGFMLRDTSIVIKLNKQKGD